MSETELIAVSARVNNALKRLGSGWAMFVEAHRTPCGSYPCSSFPEPLSWLIDAERRAAFENDGAHYESHYTLTLLFLPPDEAMALKPDTVLLLAWNFREEILGELRQRGFKGDVIVPLPGDPRVIAV